jgi:hypothetical protein
VNEKLHQFAARIQVGLPQRRLIAAFFMRKKKTENQNR